jgi:hypothetical protein
MVFGLIIVKYPFNTVQGWNTHTGLSYTKRNEEKRAYTGNQFKI